MFSTPKITFKIQDIIYWWKDKSNTYLPTEAEERNETDFPEKVFTALYLARDSSPRRSPLWDYSEQWNEKLTELLLISLLTTWLEGRDWKESSCILFDPNKNVAFRGGRHS